MLRRLVLAFTLLFMLSAAASAFGLGTPSRGANASHHHPALAVLAQDLGDDGVIAADSGALGDHGQGFEPSDWPDSIHLTTPFMRLPRLIHPPVRYTATALPFPPLVPLQRPPCLRA